MKDFEKDLWKLFQKTGKINYYVLYRNVKEKDDGC